MPIGPKTMAAPHPLVCAAAERQLPVASTADSQAASVAHCHTAPIAVLDVEQTDQGRRVGSGGAVDRLHGDQI